MANARSTSEGQSASTNTLRQLFLDLPGGTGGDLSRDMDDINNLRANSGGQDPSDMSPQELHATIWKILSFRDSVMKKIEVGYWLEVVLIAGHHRQDPRLIGSC